MLDKPGKLDAVEWEAMKSHAALSAAILARVPAFRDMAPVVAAHHERLDGKGYPNGLAGKAIALETRIITTADVFDAITARRPYSAPRTPAEAFAAMERDRGVAIDGRCLDALRAAAAEADWAPPPADLTPHP